MAIVTLQDLPRNPINYSADYVKYQELILKYTALTTTGNVTWTSPSSGVTYPATSGGESQLLGLIQVALSDYLLNASKWNSIQTELGNYLLKIGGTLSGFLAMARNELRQPKMKDYTEVATILTGSGTITLDLSTGNNFVVTPTGTTTIAVSNWATSPQWHPFTLEIVQGATPYAITFPSSFKFPNDIAPNVAQANKVSTITGYSRDGGTKVRVGSLTSMSL